MIIPEFWFAIEAGLVPAEGGATTLPVQIRWGQFDLEGKRLGDGFRDIAIDSDDYLTEVLPMPVDPTPTSRILKVHEITFFNTDSITRRIVLRRRQRDALVTYPIAAATVDAGGRYAYTPETGWMLYNAAGAPVSDTGTVAGAPSEGATAIYSVPFHADGTAAITLTNQVQAAGFLGGSNRNIHQLDLAGYTECRIVARIATGSASVNTPRLRVGYSSAFTTTIGSYVDIGTSVVAASMTTAGVARSAWVPLATDAKADGVHVTVIQEGGDAAADPVLGFVLVEFR